MNPRSFVSGLDHDRIVAAIRAAEERSRGEIRVHVSGQKVEDPERAAAALFEKLGMAATAERNGVLLFVAPSSQRFAVVGDKGIHERCGEGFWKDVAAAMEDDFRAGRFTDGLVKGVTKAGDALATHFPRTGRPDANELSDEVSED
jgi:uncharacterized membrane protein